MSKIQSYTPSELLSQDYAPVVDLTSILEKYENNSAKYLSTGTFKVDKKQVKLALKGEITTKGVATNEWENNGKKTTTYSLGIRFEDGEDTESFDQILINLKDHLSPDFDMNDIIKNDILYLKLKADSSKKSFAGIKSNVKLDPKKPTEFPSSGDTVTVIADLGYYVNVQDSKAGITITPKQFIFESEEVELPPTKKQKV